MLSMVVSKVSPLALLFFPSLILLFVVGNSGGGKRFGSLRGGSCTQDSGFSGTSRLAGGAGDVGEEGGVDWRRRLLEVFGLVGGGSFATGSVVFVAHTLSSANSTMIAASSTELFFLRGVVEGNGLDSEGRSKAADLGDKGCP